MKRFFFAPFVFAALLPLTAFADVPAIVSYVADPPSASYAIGTDLSWNVVNGLAPDFYITCPAGVTIKKDSGTIIPCNTLTTVSPLAKDIAALSFVNLTGSTQTLGFRLIPKGSDGTEYPDLAQTLDIPVGPVPQPIRYFSSSSSTPASGALVTFTWAGAETSGVNLRFDCEADISILTDASNPYSAVPCDQAAFPTDLPQSGSQALTIVNKSLFTEPVGVKVMPAITPSVYDSTHGVYLTLYVQGATVTPPPAVSSFTASDTSIPSGTPVTFSWAAEYADGANLQFTCADGIVMTNQNGSVPCNTLAFGAPLAATGSTTITFTAVGVPPRPVTAFLLPYVKGAYDATKGKSIQLTAGAAHSAAPAPPPVSGGTNSSGASQTSGGGSTTAPPGSIKAVLAAPITLAMQKGSTGAQVTALQQFLAEDPSLYPEGIVSGYFGSLTESAVQRFQARYGIISSGTAATTGYGAVGPKTRSKINSLQYF